MSEQSQLGSYQYGSEAKIYERLIFNFRPALLLFFALATVFLSYQMLTKSRLETDIFKMIPSNHPFIENMRENLDDVGAAGSQIQIAVEHKSGDIFDKDFMNTLKQISDELFYFPGVDRRSLESVWTPNIRWNEVTEEGFEGGPVLPNAYDGSEAKLAEFRLNILRSGRVGSLVSDNFKSSIVQVNLFDKNPDTGVPLDYVKFSEDLEKEIRAKYETEDIKIHIVGYAKFVGDLTEGGKSMGYFFVAAIGIIFVLLFLYTFCFISVLTPLFCSIIAVIWQLGILATLGLGITAYSMLVPFLVFAIAISHGIQVVNTIALEKAEGSSSELSARKAFRALYIPGMTALISDGVGFITLWVIDIDAIRELAIAASVGIGIIVLTNLVLLPILMSYFGVSKSGIKHVVESNNKKHPILEKLSYLASPKVAKVSIIIALIGFAIGGYGSKNLKIGDLDAGAPELHPDSRYNLDNKYIADNYAVSSDVFLIMVKTLKEKCSTYENIEVIDRFGWVMENVEGVQSSISLTFVIRQILTGFNEGNLKWNTIPRDQRAINSTFFQIPNQLVNTDCSYAPLVLFLDDHKAETLTRVVAAAKQFIAENPMKELEFLLATGSAGVEAATNEVITDAQSIMLMLIYAVVIILIFASFNSLAAVACIVIPLALTSSLCQALMAYLGIGVKVATLPVIALGVGIGVDYGIYIYGKLETYLKQGMNLQEAYYNTLRTTGKAVLLTGIALAICVGTWVLSPIKFQADMGKLLTFMFLLNMVGAIWLLPALAHFLIKPEKVMAKEQRKKENKKMSKAVQ